MKSSYTLMTSDEFHPCSSDGKVLLSARTCYSVPSCLDCVSFCRVKCVQASHPAAPWSGTLRQSRFGCWRLPPRSFTWLMLLGRCGRAELWDDGCLWPWCCEFLWLFLMPPFWWATAERKDLLLRALRWTRSTRMGEELRCCTWGSRCSSWWHVLVGSGAVCATLSEALPGWALGKDIQQNYLLCFCFSTRPQWL